jgi:hypothetical protein
MPGVRHDPRSVTVERMTIQRMNHVGIVVDDLAGAKAFFVELGRAKTSMASATGGLTSRVVRTFDGLGRSARRRSTSKP